MTRQLCHPELEGKGSLLSAYVGTIFHFQCPERSKDLSYQFHLGPNSNWVLDAKHCYLGSGRGVNEGFKKANVKICHDNLHGPKSVKALYWVAKRDIAADEELLGNYGADFWKIAAHYHTLSAETKKICRKFYGFEESDVV